jgi:lipid II:glycine glycyltransferase (peptidoglycan interpeptide bridge formation enzyme)
MRKRALYSEIRNVEDATPLILQMSKERHHFVSHLNFLVDLEGGEKKVYSDVSPTLRKKIRRAEKKGIQIEGVSSRNGLETLYSLVKDTYNRVHIPLLDIEVFRAAGRELAPMNCIRMTLAKHNGRAVAGRAALIYNGRIFDWFAGSNDEGYHLDAGAYLVWDMLRWGIRQGLSVFDFGGAGNPDETYKVRDFKSRFHGRLVNHGRFIKIYSRTRYHLGRSAYAVVRRVSF